jgi:hypothetical protein
MYFCCTKKATERSYFWCLQKYWRHKKLGMKNWNGF